MELTEGAVVADRFRLVRQLGKGGMGEVWLAQHNSLDIPCAVKFIHAETAANPEARARFEREAKAAAQLRTPNVVQILDYGVHEKTPYIAMELLEGEPLSARLARRGRLDAHETFRIVAQVGKALTKAHAAGIVHRDLKPENVFLVADDEGEIAKVLDFGVAKQTIGLTNSNTKTGALLGTPFYMSPEQAQGIKTVDSRADLWSLAVLSYRCLTGELPFRSEALGDLLIKIVTSPIPVPSRVATGIPPAFDPWWERASQRESEHRFQTAKELVESLGMALGVSVPSGLGRSGMAPGAYPAGGGADAHAGGPSWEDSGIIMPAAAAQAAGPGHPPAATQPFPVPPHAAQQGQAGLAVGPTVAASPGAGDSGVPGYPAAMDAPGGTAAMPAADGTGRSPALASPAQAAGVLGGSGSGASVAGFATHAVRPSGPNKQAIIGIVIAASLVMGSLGVFVVYRVSVGGEETAETATETAEPAATGEAPADDGEPTADEPEDGATEDTSAADRADTDAAAPEATADADAPAEPTQGPPLADTRPKPKPTPKPYATDLGPVGPRPKPKPEPKPKPTSGTPDFGF